MVHTSRQRAVLLDRDGVLNKRPAPGCYVRRWEEFAWLSGAREALHLFAETDYRVIVVTNQAGIAKGLITEETLRGIHARMRSDAEAAGGRIDAVYYCPHTVDAGCACRKPRPGLIWLAQREFQLALAETILIGDDSSDGEAAQTAGCGGWLHVSEDHSLLDCARQLLLTYSSK